MITRMQNNTFGRTPCPNRDQAFFLSKNFSLPQLEPKLKVAKSKAAEAANNSVSKRVRNGYARLLSSVIESKKLDLKA